MGTCCRERKERGKRNGAGQKSQSAKLRTAGGYHGEELVGDGGGNSGVGGEEEREGGERRVVGEERGERGKEGGVREKAEREGGSGRTEEMEPVLGDERDGRGGGRRRRKLEEDFLEEFIAEYAIHLEETLNSVFSPLVESII